ncbi:MAG: sugar transferase [Bacteroidales bacterium]|nr:sugar transferase [Bacteroidales bacterium]
MKRFLDILISSVAILILSPLLIVVAVIIRIESPGPVIYKSRRAGRNYKIFDFYKFRSMRKDADSMLGTLLNQNQYHADKGLSNFVKIENDPRVTPFGHFIRKYSIDELPQLFNVLKGDMSLVGNRPLPLYEARTLTDDKYSARFDCPAGLTGLWQVEKRGDNGSMSPEERKMLDVRYAENHNLWMDFVILMRTFTNFVQKGNV